MDISYYIYYVILIIILCLLIISDSFRTIIKYEIKQMIYAGADILDDYFFRQDNTTELLKKTGEIAIVTGGERGIGVEIVKMLLKCDMHVVIGCRKTEAGVKVESDARQEGINTGSLECIPLDLDSLESIENFSKTVSQKYSKINILINNAATLSENYMVTTDGFESHLGVNYLGHFFLTHLLLPNLMNAGSSTDKSRIVNVSSCSQYFGDINFEDIHLKKQYIQMMGYSQSKLAIVISGIYLNSKFQKENIPVEVFSVNPGVVDTDMVRSLGIHKLFPFIPPLFYKTPQQGATPIIHSAISPKLNGKGGSYISNCRIKAVNPKAESTFIQEKLYNLSKELLNITEFGNPVSD